MVPGQNIANGVGDVGKEAASFSLLPPNYSFFVSMIPLEMCCRRYRNRNEREIEMISELVSISSFC